MRVLVYPHDLNLGGSQLNAIELAASVRDLGHECVIYGRPGTLGERIDELGLEFIESPDPGRRPSPRVAADLRRLIAARGIDIVHGYEWPPGLEAVLGTAGAPGAQAVCTVMSMAVAPFLPRTLSLVVGTRQIAAHERAAGRMRVDVLEPPVDLAHNLPPGDAEMAAFAARWGIGQVPLVVCVSRLAAELKSEGILSAIEVIGSLQAEVPCQLLIVGDGPAAGRVRDAAERVNRNAGTDVVVLTGELADPRPAYAAADVTVGMGGSALRALAFGRPLIVQGEGGFFETLTPESVDLFRWQGWYGVGPSAADGPERLAGHLLPLLQDDARRRELGRFGRGVVEEFSLTRAARRQVEIYAAALAESRWGVRTLPDAVRAAGSFGRYYASKRLARLRGTSRTDDFNARPVAATAASAPPPPSARVPGGTPDVRPLVYFAGVDWDAVPGTDRRLAEALARIRPVVWVDPPQSVWSAYRRGVRVPVLSRVGEGIERVHTYAPPGVTRPGLRTISEIATVAGVRRHLRKRAAEPVAALASGTQPFLAHARGLGCPLVYFATDDAVAGAALWGMSAQRIARDREANLAAADLVLAVTSELADELRRDGSRAVVFPNGCDPERYRGIDDAAPAPDVRLSAPIAGVIGQFNERTDLALLEAVADAGVRLLLVGPQYYATRDAAEAFGRLAARSGVQWVGRVPPDALPGYLKLLSVGLTAYVDNPFNRRSFPLKTLDYLAAGVPVVASRVAPVAGLDERFVRLADSPADFAAAVEDVIGGRPRRAEIQESVRSFRWQERAAALEKLIAGGAS